MACFKAASSKPSKIKATPSLLSRSSKTSDKFYPVTVEANAELSVKS